MLSRQEIVDRIKQTDGWPMEKQALETCLELFDKLDAAEEALAWIENIDPSLYDNAIATVVAKREEQGDGKA